MGEGKYPLLVEQVKGVHPLREDGGHMHAPIQDRVMNKLAETWGWAARWEHGTTEKRDLPRPQPCFCIAAHNAEPWKGSQGWPFS